jgi:hypothetical protein
VGSSYVPADFVVIETCGDEKSPIILGRPFLNTAGAIMYTNTAKIYFNIKGKRETFCFKDKVLQFPAHPQHPYEPKKKNNRRNKNKNKNRNPQQMESVRVITAVTESMIISSSPHICSRETTQVSQLLNAQLTEAPFRKLSVTLDQEST